MRCIVQKIRYQSEASRHTHPLIIFLLLLLFPAGAAPGPARGGVPTGGGPLQTLLRPTLCLPGGTGGYRGAGIHHPGGTGEGSVVSRQLETQPLVRRRKSMGEGWSKRRNWGWWLMQEEAGVGVAHLACADSK